MFNKTPVTEPAHEVSDMPNTPIPLTHLALDLPEPPIGWAAYLNNIGVELLRMTLGVRRFIDTMPGCFSANIAWMSFGRLRCVLRPRSGLSRLISVGGRHCLVDRN
jgi:hypothetical protein